MVATQHHSNMLAAHGTNIIGHRQQHKGQKGRDNNASREAPTRVSKSVWPELTGLSYEVESSDAKVEMLKLLHSNCTWCTVCMPIRNKKTTALDKPRMTKWTKAAIRKRQKTFNRWGENNEMEKIQKHSANASQGSKWKNYYKTEIQNLKKENP